MLRVGMMQIRSRDEPLRQQGETYNLAYVEREMPEDAVAASSTITDAFNDITEEFIASWNYSHDEHILGPRRFLMRIQAPSILMGRMGSVQELYCTDEELPDMIRTQVIRGGEWLATQYVLQLNDKH